ncbi:FecR domain-containing protein [Opitutus sp. ER46]|uniref:FecR family protein n=1 Tax=Opitutus sp. ER46 TaxID=2161864 RepID=UPI000D2FCB37|nr:FecR domain-containing protein [Opitutus sp. ER46]PTX98541.1 hypothetical protein DB354_04570 [Opitutus sp. ER46]
MKRRSAAASSEAAAIEATAAAWVAQRDGGFSPEEAQAFAAWCAADPRHAAAVARLEGAWQALQQLRDFRPAAQRHPDRDLLRPPAPARRAPVLRLRHVVPLALAASLTVLAFWWTGRPDASAAGEHYATTVDGYQRVTLADGSVVELNGSSEVVVQFTAATRHVELRRGEAHFTVARNPARPFLVQAGDIAVRAVGTAFNVRLGREDIEVLVTEGKVDVAPPALLAPAPASSPSPAPGASTPRYPVLTPTRLTANERAVVHALAAPHAAPPAPVVERLAPERVRAALAWQGPRLVFVDTPLAEVVTQFNRRNQLQLVVADPALATLPVGGSFRAENVEAFVRLLESDGDIVADRSAPGRILLRRP